MRLDAKGRAYEAALKSALEDWPHRRWPTKREWFDELGRGGLYLGAKQVMTHTQWAKRLGYRALAPGKRPVEDRKEWTDERIEGTLQELFIYRKQAGLPLWPSSDEWRYEQVTLYKAMARSHKKGVSYWKKRTAPLRNELSERKTLQTG